MVAPFVVVSLRSPWYFNERITVREEKKSAIKIVTDYLLSTQEKNYFSLNKVYLTSFFFSFFFIILDSSYIMTMPSAYPLLRNVMYIFLKNFTLHRQVIFIYIFMLPLVEVLRNALELWYQYKRAAPLKHFWCCWKILISSLGLFWKYFFKKISIPELDYLNFQKH